MLNRTLTRAALGAAIACSAAAFAAAVPAAAQISVSESDGVRAGELAVPVNKSQVLRSDRPFAKALIGNPDIADVLPLSDQSIYVLGKKMGTTSLTLYDRRNMLIAVVDIAVGPDVIGLKRQLSELMPGDQVGARIANDSVVLEGIVSSGPAADRAVQLAETYAPGKVINLLSIGSAQQVMLEVRFSEIKRGALKDLGFSSFVEGSGSHGFQGAIGGGASLSGSLGSTTTVSTDPVTGDVTTTTTPNAPTLSLGSIVDSFGILTRMFKIAGLNFDVAFNALERKGVVTTLAEPTLVALSGETASFLAGGEFPIPVAQSGNSGGDSAISVQFKQFGVSLAFTPTVLADGVINLEVAPEVSSIDASASVVVNNLRIPGLQTRRAHTTVELRDGESFALAGLIRRDFQDTIRQFPVLGSIPIIGTLFRSTNFQKEETELVIIVTPRLVKPVRAAAMKVPTDRATAPDEVDLFLLGRPDTGVGVNPLAPTQPSPAGRPIGETSPAPAPGGMAALDPSKLEKDYGHAF
ncbi:type II and III secretion system protein family protein [Sphingomonas sp. RB56-2]|uniref:Type II and III secretion system protein family protein n=1 Tax=Sphingomonas brevis TaxID=2908206 RepID=A0ABT0SAP0_9SPHN|nr:type II and III secretion system protein family protein [Sphingomonas brevis]MCL6741413.1 type II and III secretion system protein family protein [Sphingomonas brevis]